MMKTGAFIPRNCQFCGDPIQPHLAAGRPRLFCGKPCRLSMGLTFARGLAQVSAGGSVRIEPHLDLVSAIVDRGASGCLGWLLRQIHFMWVNRRPDRGSLIAEFLEYCDAEKLRFESIDQPILAYTSFLDSRKRDRV